jgi:CXXX repeat peptide maturase
MLQYLVIILDDTSVSYCHYENPKIEQKLIALADLEAGIFFGMKQNLRIQFVYPDYDLPEDYKNAIEHVDNNKIASALSMEKNADVVIFNDWRSMQNYDFSNSEEKAFVIRTTKNELYSNCEKVETILDKITRLNIVPTDIETFKTVDFEQYGNMLNKLKSAVKDVCKKGKLTQLNILTDRIMLDKMNNCNAGIENITLAPNGKFYICPAFYFENENDFVGDLKNGVEIKNKQLYKFEYAPICRECDAYQCKRCVWLNRKTTLEVNTPSHEQCVVAHLERNESHKLLPELQEFSIFLDKSIKEIDYLDPFDVIKRF